MDTISNNIVCPTSEKTVGVIATQHGRSVTAISREVTLCVHTYIYIYIYTIFLDTL
jgi:hypothetical protein